jgi:CBS domain-containing protein
MSSDQILPDVRVRDVLEMKGSLDRDTSVLTAAPTDTVYDCIDRMVGHEVGSIVVVDNDAVNNDSANNDHPTESSAGENGIAGIFTERDYMRKIALEGRSSDDTPVASVMTTDVATVGRDRSLEDCLGLMTALQCRHLPVVGDTGSLDGIVSSRDCMQKISEAAKSKAAELTRYMEEKYPVDRRI